MPGVLLLDSMGELGALFEHATVVFMGGTLASRGGHNILEPAYFGKPVIAGPHMENFAAIAEEFTSSGALVRIARAGRACTHGGAGCWTIRIRRPPSAVPPARSR